MENEINENKNIPKIPKNLINQGLVFFNFLGGLKPKEETLLETEENLKKSLKELNRAMLSSFRGDL